MQFSSTAVKDNTSNAVSSFFKVQQKQLLATLYNNERFADTVYWIGPRRDRHCRQFFALSAHLAVISHKFKLRHKYE